MIWLWWKRLHGRSKGSCPRQRPFADHAPRNMALDEFTTWFRQEPRAGFGKAKVSACRALLEARRLGSSSIIIRMSAIRKLAAGVLGGLDLPPSLAAEDADEATDSVGASSLWPS